MKHTKYKIALLVGSVVVVLLMLFLLIFNIGIRVRIRSESKSAINEAFEEMDPDSEDEDELYIDESSMYMADILFVPQDENIAEEYLNLYGRKAKGIIDWCERNEPWDFKEAHIGSFVYYLQMRAYDLEDAGYETYISYVDVTGAYETIHWIDGIFFIAALLIGLIGSGCGAVLGKRLEQNERTERQFFENTSHELKTPLTAIRGYAEAIETGVIMDYPKAGRVIAEQADKMSSLVEDILVMAKLESGAMTLHKEDLDVPEFIQDCLMPFEGVIKGRNPLVSFDPNIIITDLTLCRLTVILN